MTTHAIRVRHKSFKDATGIAVRETTKRYVNGEEYPGCIVQWGKGCMLLDTIMANFNLVFIVPAGSRKLEK